MNKEEIEHWFNKGVAVGYHSARNDKELAWMKPLHKLFGMLFEIRYPTKSCDHQWYEKTNGGACCIWCETSPKTHTWYCKESPDHLCHYTKGTHDECDFCGQPQERK